MTLKTIKWMSDAQIGARLSVLAFQERKGRNTPTDRLEITALEREQHKRLDKLR